MLEDFPDDVAFQAANDFSFAFSLTGALLDVVDRWLMTLHPDDCDTEQCCIGLPVATTVQTKAFGFAA